MTKDSVIKMREAFSTSPIKITCDNMIVRWDNTGKYPNIIWDDDNEVLTAFMPTTEDIQEGFPFEIFTTEYEHIQYMEAYVTPKVAMEWLIQNKATMGDENYNLAIEQVKQQIGKRGYTGTVPMKNVLQK